MADKTISQRDTKYAKNTSFQGGLTDVLIALKNNIFRNLNVATIGEVISTNESDNTVQVKLLPQASGEISKNITCNSLSFPIVKTQDNAETIEWRSYASVLAMHDLVLVLYTNRNSSQNIKQHSMNATYSALSKDRLELHSDKFGVVIGLVSKYSQGGKTE